MQDIRVRPRRPAVIAVPIMEAEISDSYSAPASISSPISAAKPKRHIFRKTLTVMTMCLLMSGAYYVFVAWDTPAPINIVLPPNLSRLEMSQVIANDLGWSEEGKQLLASTFAQMQWAAFNRELIDLMAERFDWDEDRKESFAINSTSYLEPELDFLGGVYVPDTYTIESSASDVEVASMLLANIQTAAAGDVKGFLDEHITDDEAAKVNKFVLQEMELLPDLVPVPARDVSIERTEGKTLLRFSTIYFNQGEGPMELRADPKTIGLRQDAERDVFQRVYRTDGTYREKVVGTFMWHQEHLHYHFADFIVYDLDAVDVKGAPDLSGSRVKTTFCLRDVSRVDLELDNRPEDAEYKICGKRVQGVSVGWADTYFSTYPDQALNISDLPSGVYSLTFHVNESSFLEESNLENNKSKIVFSYDAKAGKVKVLEESPEEAPTVKHVYKETPGE